MYDEIAGATIVDPSVLETIDFNSILKPDPVNGKIAAYFNKHWGYSLNDYCNPHDFKIINIILNEYQNNLVFEVPPSRKPYYVKKLLHKTIGAFVLVRRIRKGRYASPNDYRTLIAYFLPAQFSDYLANFALSIGLKIWPLRRDGEVSI